MNTPTSSHPPAARRIAETDQPVFPCELLKAHPLLVKEPIWLRCETPPHGFTDYRDLRDAFGATHWRPLPEAPASLGGESDLPGEKWSWLEETLRQETHLNADARCKLADRILERLATPSAPSSKTGEEESDEYWRGYQARLDEQLAERPKPKHPTLWRYLDDAHKNGVTFHALGVNRQPDGGYHFYIHPQSVSGDTQDFLIWPDPFDHTDMLVNRLDSPAPDVEKFKAFLAQELRAARQQTQSR
jgi:hypothetical protein